MKPIDEYPNYMNANELAEVAMLAQGLTEVFKKRSLVSFDSVQVSDSNGEPLCVLLYEGGEFVVPIGG